ncbi:hypothetical protein [Streptomyces sp. NPDC091217]|uniref:hypothetical protein n=1 Tax=Streptomyces sp. NPDC091217 TaxID=3365975 RepID=UPI0037F5C32E
MSTTGRRWVVRFSWAALAVPTSAALTAIAFGLVYGASLTPVGWRNTFVMGFVGVMLVGGPMRLAFVLYDFRTENTEESAQVREVAVAICVAVTMFLGWIVLKDLALHERGRPVRAVVTALEGSASPFDAGTEAILADAPPTTRSAPSARGTSLSVTTSPSPSIPGAGTASVPARRPAIPNGSGRCPP